MSEPVAPLGAHVSAAGGLHTAPARARKLNATVLQLFTKPPQRWAERVVDSEEAGAFREARHACGVRIAAAHDSYLINLASPDRTLRDRSLAAFRAELERCVRLGLDFLVTHPGNATDGDRPSALRRNAEGLATILAERDGSTKVLVETTAGSGSVLGWRFEELADLLEAVPASVRPRVGICLDTAHVHAAGYDLSGDPEGLLDEFERVLGMERLLLLHLNDSKSPRGSRVDRHADIGRGAIGEGAFATLLGDSRVAAVPRLIETPKPRGSEEAAEAADRRNLETLRRLMRP